MTEKDIVVFSVAACYVLIWLLHAARTVFVLIRGNIPDDERKYYTRLCVIHTFVYAVLGIFIWAIPFLFILLGLREELFRHIKIAYLINFYFLVPALAIAGFFMQKRLYAQILSLSVFVLYGLFFYYMQLLH